MATTKKKRSFDAAFKLRVAAYAEQNTSRGAGRKFGVDEKISYQLPVHKRPFPRIVAALEL